MKQVFLSSHSFGHGCHDPQLAISQRWTQVTVSLQPGAAAEVVDAAPEERAEGPFTLCSLGPGPGYVAAVVAQGVGWRLSCWQWS